MMKIYIQIYTTTFIMIVTFITTSESQRNKCFMKETCGACIRELGCVWCNNPFSIYDTSTRCTTIFDNNWCDKINIINPKSSLTVLKNKPVQTSSHGKATVQISPQRVKLTLRRGEEFELKFKYVQAEDYPVDLYYLMDLSSSMEKHRKKLSKLGSKLAMTMKNLTKNFKLGFGSFVDKVEMPFVSTVPEKLQTPCRLNNVPCVPPYSFKNHLSLTEETNSFIEQVRDAKVSGGLDNPEGGFDALMQAMVCHEEIGWRPKARHLLVFSTDAGFHIAGDGKLAGIVHPHDGRCYMTNHMYTHSSLLDYPSIGQINQKAIENNIHVIFAVEDRQTTIYRALKDRIKDSSIATLSTENFDVVDLVADAYDKIVDSVKITDNSDYNIEIKYYSACRTYQEKETNECNNLTPGVQVDFRAVIKLVNCPDTPNKTRIFEIKPGALNESLIVEVEMICDCDCEKQEKPKAPECHNSGSLQCGICNCDSGKFGSNCECSGYNFISTDDLSSCRMTNTSAVCSGLGTCKCNKCDCHKRTNEDEKITGKFCECNNYSCKRSRGLLCSGEDHGICDCGKCDCFPDWQGEDCACPDNIDTCITNGKVCSNRGDCVCGQCECHLVDGYRYSGQYCDECPTCEGKLCDELKHCVECKTHKTGIYNEDECLRNCNKFHINTIDKIEDEKRKNEQICWGDIEDCRFYYKYSYDVSKSLSIYAVKTKVCKAENNIPVFPFIIIIGSILLPGIILLVVWKTLTTIYDRRKHAKSETDRNIAMLNPTSTYENPTFGSS